MTRAIRCGVVCLVAVLVLGGVQGAFAAGASSAIVQLKPVKRSPRTVPEPATLAMLQPALKMVRLRCPLPRNLRDRGCTPAVSDSIRRAATIATPQSAECSPNPD